MKKNFIWFLIAAITVVFSIAATSCNGKDNTENFSPDYLTGKWYLSRAQGYEYYDGEREDYDIPFTEAQSELFFTFHSNGMGVAEYKYGTMSYLNDITWTLNGNKLSITTEADEYDDEETEVFTVKTLTSSTLKLQLKDQDEDGPYEYTLTFSKIS